MCEAMEVTRKRVCEGKELRGKGGGEERDVSEEGGVREGR